MFGCDKGFGGFGGSMEEWGGMHSEYEDDDFGFESVREMMNHKNMRNFGNSQMTSMTMSTSTMGGQGGNFV